jgi:hypothetical protein
MPFIPAVNTARVSLQCNLDGQNMINTTWFKHRAGAITLTNLEDLGAGMNDWFAGSILPSLGDAVQFLGCVVYDYTSDFAPAVNVPVLGAFGLDTALMMPNNAAFCVKFLTGGRGRSSRGRNYISGFTNDSRDGLNHVSAAFADAMVAAYNAILALPLDADWEWSVASFHTAGAPRAAALVQPIVGAAYTDTIIDSQRRRLPGRGD